MWGAGGWGAGGGITVLMNSHTANTPRLLAIIRQSTLLSLLLIVVNWCNNGQNRCDSWGKDRVNVLVCCVYVNRCVWCVYMCVVCVHVCGMCACVWYVCMCGVCACVVCVVVMCV